MTLSSDLAAIRARVEVVPSVLELHEYCTQAITDRKLLLVRLEETVVMLQLIIPLAKGYVVEHPVGSNQRYVNEAEAALRPLGEPG